jgi:Uma2 family endonuclease
MSAARQIEFPVHTRDEFYELERTSSVRHEFYGGHIVAMAGGSPRHGRIIGEVAGILRNALLNTSCFAVPNDQLIRVEDADMDAYPDVVVYCEDAAFDSRFERTLLEPLVLVEVLSPSTKNVDLTSKRAAYFNLPTLTDYLIFWQDKIRLDQFVRDPNSSEPVLRRHLNRDSRVRLDALGIEFRLGDCYRRFDELGEGSE